MDHNKLESSSCRKPLERKTEKMDFVSFFVADISAVAGFKYCNATTM